VGRRRRCSPPRRPLKTCGLVAGPAVKEYPIDHAPQRLPQLS
jgi:hypothetical protein